MRSGLLFLVLVAALAGCGGGPRQLAGDADGVLVELTVTLSRNFVRDLKNRGPGGPEVVVYEHFGSGFYSPYPYGYRGRRYYSRGYYGDPFWSSGVWVSGPAPTTVHLLAGDGPAEGRLFRTELDYGDNRLIVPVKPGRKVVLTVQAYGGLDGWEEVGSFTADNRPGQVVVLDLKEHPARVGVQDPPAPPMPPPPPGASAPGPSVNPPSSAPPAPSGPPPPPKT